MRRWSAALCSAAYRPGVIAVLTCANDRNLRTNHPCDHEQRPHHSAEAESSRAIAGGEYCARTDRCSRDAGIQSQRAPVSGSAGARSLRLRWGWPLSGLRRGPAAHVFRRPPRPPGCLSLPALALDCPCGALAHSRNARMTLPAAQVSGVYNAELIAMVAHELRQPLLPIRHAAALLGNAVPDPATMRRAAEIIEREADNMNRLIGDLVDVSRMQSGALELRCKRAPLSELMDRAIESAGLLASDLGHRLSVSVPPEPIYLQMDVLRLCEALHNLIANACEHANKQGHIQ